MRQHTHQGQNEQGTGPGGRSPRLEASPHSQIVKQNETGNQERKHEQRGPSVCDASAERECEVFATHVAEDVDVRGVRREHQRYCRERGHALGAAFPDRGAYQAVRQIVQ